MKDTLTIRKLTPTYWLAVLPQRYHTTFRMGYQMATGMKPRMKVPYEDMPVDEQFVYEQGERVAGERLACPNWVGIGIYLHDTERPPQLVKCVCNER
jgi:hypothetical protein